MKTKTFAVAALGLATIISASASVAGAVDYEIQPIAVNIKNGAFTIGMRSPSKKLTPG